MNDDKEFGCFLTLVAAAVCIWALSCSHQCSYNNGQIDALNGDLNVEVLHRFYRRHTMPDGTMVLIRRDNKQETDRFSQQIIADIDDAIQKEQPQSAPNQHKERCARQRES